VEQKMAEKVIVITGASKGIGSVLAKKLSERGDKLMIAARSSDELKRTSRWCGRNALAFATDVTQRVDVNRLRDEALNAYGHVDVWINNAGRGINRPVLEITDEDFDQIMAVNVKSALYGMQAIIPHFKEQGEGHLINVSSFLSRIPWATNRSVYSAAKAALNSLTANLRMDLRKEYPNIQVSLVMPGMVTTDFHQNALHGMPTPEGWTPPPGAQTPEEVAAVIVDLIDNPKAEVYTNPAIQVERVRRYFEDVGAFEESM
jgi:short-subunit dehydrogenase